MSKLFKTAVVAAVLALGLAALPAQAGPINGSITVSDGIVAASLGGPTAVSGLLSITHTGLGDSSGCTDDYAGQASCFALSSTMTDWTFTGPYGTIVVVDGWTFAVTGAASVGSTFFCADKTCSDTQVIAMVGFVSGNGFDPTLFTGTLAMTGGCTESGTVANTCASNYSGGYTYTFVSRGTPRETPEPATLALVGIALLGIGALRRRS